MSNSSIVWSGKSRAASRGRWVVPRQFLREFVTQMDVVDENPEYEPLRDYEFSPSGLNVEEQHVLEGALVQV